MLWFTSLNFQAKEVEPPNFGVGDNILVSMRNFVGRAGLKHQWTMVVKRGTVLVH